MIEITPVIVTRGNVDLAPVLKCLDYAEPGLFVDDVIVWDNAKAIADLKTYGLYLGCGQATTELVYVQDDDCIVENWTELLKYWEPGRIVCNMPPEFQRAYANKADRLMGFGAIFERSLIRPTFERYIKRFGITELLLRESNRIFTALNHDRCLMTYVGRENCDYASADDRLWKQKDHRQMHVRALQSVEDILRIEEAER